MAQTMLIWYFDVILAYRGGNGSGALVEVPDDIYQGLRLGRFPTNNAPALL
jgi:hypothetical protein